MDKLTIKTNYPEEVEVGTEVSTCTAEFGYDSITGRFENNISSYVTIEVEHVGEDYSEYVPGKACNGGCYGYDYWKVINVVEDE